MKHDILRNNKNALLFLTSRLLFSMASKLAFFSIIWYTTSHSIAYLGLLLFCYNLLELVLIPFVSSLTEKLNTQYVIINLTLFILAFALISYFYINYFNQYNYLLLIIMLFLGVINAFSAPLTTVVMYNLYGEKVKSGLKLAYSFSSINMIILPIFSIGGVLTLGINEALAASIGLAIISILLACFLKLPTNIPVSKVIKINETIVLMKKILQIRSERIISIVLLVINACLNPFFLFALPVSFKTGYISSANYWIFFEVLFAAGYCMSGIFMPILKLIHASNVKQIEIGIFFLIMMISSILIISPLLWSITFVLGGIGLALIIININGFRINAAPKHLKNKIFSILTFYSLVLTPFSMLLFTKIFLAFSLQNIIYCFITLMSLSLIYLCYCERLICVYNDDMKDSKEYYTKYLL